MNSLSQDFINQVVTEVVTKLRERYHVLSSQQSQPSKQQFTLTDRVITEAVLEQKLGDARQITISPQSILTPSAKDYLRRNNVKVGHQGETTITSKIAVGRILCAHQPVVVRNVLSDRKIKAGWPTILENNTEEAIDHARSLLCRAEANSLILLVNKPFLAVRELNRNDKCRAAFISNENDAKQADEEIEANIFCLDLREPSYMRIRNLVLACQRLIPPSGRAK